jgi:hypothetical protein
MGRQNHPFAALAGKTANNRYISINIDELERFPHVLTRQGFPLLLRCDSDFLLVAGGQHGWHERFHRIFGTGLSQRLIAG